MDRIAYNGSDKWKEKATELLNQGGGSNVIANPSGTATDNLLKLQVDQIIYAVTGGGGVNYINIPQSDFTYISSNKSFSVDLSNYNIVKSDILAIGVYCESGASVWGGNITANNELEITGWCPFLSRAIDNGWTFTCNIILNSGGGGGGSDAEVVVHTTAEWQGLTSLVSKKGGIYIWSDYKTENGVNIPAIKIGDGLAYVVDLPFATLAITQTQINNWNNKVSARVSGENLILEN